MKPITRKEYYLAKAAGTYTGPTPPPVLREDYYLATLSGDYSGNCPAPVTRLDMFMSAAAGLTTYVPQPVTRIEKYWHAIAKGTGYVPEPVTREEKFLYAILKNPPKPEYLDKTAEGSLILLPDSAEAPFTAFTIYGHSTQSGTPSPDNPVPIVSAGDEGEINVSVSGAGINLLFNTGENKDYNTIHRNWGYNSQNYAKVIVTGNQAHYTVPETGTGANNNTGFGCDFAALGDTSANDIIFKRGQKYVWSCDAKGISSPNQSLSMKVFYRNTSGNDWASTGLKTVQLTEDWERYSCEFTVPDDFDEEVNRVVLNFPIGTDKTACLDIKNLKLEKGTVATKWTPNPTDGDPLNYQPLTISTPGGLPGIPVSSGGNYTDESGQQWVCDEIDLARGKYVQRVSTHLIRSVDNISNGRQQNPDYFGCMNVLGSDGIGYNKNLMSDKLVFVGINKDIDGSEITIVPGNGYMVFGLKKSVVSEETVGAVTNYLSENPITILYALKEPIETDLPAKEIAAYKTLHTYSPTTTMSNDAEAWMKVGYKAPAE